MSLKEQIDVGAVRSQVMIQVLDNPDPTLSEATSRAQKLLDDRVEGGTNRQLEKLVWQQVEGDSPPTLSAYTSRLASIRNYLDNLKAIPDELSVRLGYTSLGPLTKDLMTMATGDSRHKVKLSLYGREQLPKSDIKRHSGAFSLQWSAEQDDEASSLVILTRANAGNDTSLLTNVWLYTKAGTRSESISGRDVSLAARETRLRGHLFSPLTTPSYNFLSLQLLEELREVAPPLNPTSAG